MIRFRWWSHNLHRTRHLPRKIIASLWEPMGALPQAKDDITLAPTALTLPVLERDDSVREDTREDTFTLNATAHPETNTQAHVADSPSLPPQVAVADRQQYGSLSALPVLSPPRNKKTDMLSPLTIPNTPTMPERAPTSPSSDSLLTTQSVRKHAFQAPYLIPLDAAEVNRLDFQHYALRQSLEGNYAAPVEDPRSALDVGTGTGRWGIELATIFPQASVIGTDIMMPPLSQPPRNFVFVRNNILEGLPFASNSFDFVHQRLLLSSIPMSKLRFLVVELLRVTAPNGWIELVEVDVNVQQGGPANRKMVQWAIEASRLHGIELHFNVRIGEFLRLMSLKDVEVRSITLPLGRWGGRIGRLMSTDMVALAQAMKPRITAQKGLSDEEYEHTCWQMQQEWELHHSTLIFYIAYGQRPAQ